MFLKQVQDKPRNDDLLLSYVIVSKTKQSHSLNRHCERSEAIFLLEPRASIQKITSSLPPRNDLTIYNHYKL